MSTSSVLSSSGNATGVSSSAGTTNPGGSGASVAEVGNKRGLAEFLLGNATLPSTEVQDLFLGVSKLFSDADRTVGSAAMVGQWFESISRSEAVEDLRTVVVPTENPIDWNAMIYGDLAVFVVKGDLPTAQGGLLLRFLGVTGGRQSKVGFPEEIRMVDVPDLLISPKRSIGGSLSALESMVNEVMGRSQRAGTSASTTSGGSNGGGSDMIKKYAGCRIQDLNGDYHDLSNKDGAAKRMEQLSVLIREMNPERRGILCPDVTFTIVGFWSECMRHMDRKPDAADPLYSIAGLKDILHLPVCRDKSVLQHHLLEGHSADNWNRSLWDFVEGEEGWGRGIECQGRRNLLRAFESWVNFQVVFKGAEFEVVGEPIRALFRDQERVLDVFGAEFIWAQLEIMIRAYRYEVVTTRGRVTRRNGKHPLVKQSDCVLFLRTLAEELARDARTGRWEQFPHLKFYAPGSQFNLLILPGRRAQEANKAPYGQGGQPRTAEKGDKDTSHKFGLCMWYLAGELGMVNKRTQTKYECRDSARKHVALKHVTLGTVRKLLGDPEFMTCRTEVVKEDLVKTVEQKKHMFCK